MELVAYVAGIFFCSPHHIRVIKSRMRWTDSVARMTGMNIAYVMKILVRKTQENTSVHIR
jgi:hypothetical protein